MSLSSHEKSSSIKEKVRPVFPRTRKAVLPQVNENLKEVYEALSKRDYFFKKRTKTTRGLHNGVSKRRSVYVGVSRNKQHFQTLITTNRIKRYIGTYLTEEQAALTYDFYAIGLNKFDAKTNFSYKGEEVMRMIEHYFESDGKFDPSLFIENN